MGVVSSPLTWTTLECYHGWIFSLQSGLEKHIFIWKRLTLNHHSRVVGYIMEGGGDPCSTWFTTGETTLGVGVGLGVSRHYGAKKKNYLFSLSLMLLCEPCVFRKTTPKNATRNGGSLTFPHLNLYFLAMGCEASGSVHNLHRLLTNPGEHPNPDRGRPPGRYTFVHPRLPHNPTNGQSI